MTPLAAAHAASFNSDLYVVAATVLPVYFIALMLPGAVLARYAVWAQREHHADAVDALRYAQEKHGRKELRRQIAELEAKVAATLGDDVPEEIRTELASFRGRGEARIQRRRIGAHALGAADSLRRLPVTLCMVFGSYSEVQAVLALDHQHASPNEHTWVMGALVVLPILTVIAAIHAIQGEARAARADEGPGLVESDPDASEKNAY